MLTKSDLNQIRVVVNEEVDAVVDEKLEPIKKDLTILKSDVSILKKDVADIKDDVTVLKKDVKYLKKKVNRIDKTVSLTVENYDEGDIRLERRVKKIEAHIGLTP